MNCLTDVLSADEVFNREMVQYQLGKFSDVENVLDWCSFELGRCSSHVSECVLLSHGCVGDEGLLNGGLCESHCR